MSDALHTKVEERPLNTEAVVMYRGLGYVANSYTLFMTRKLTGEPSNEG